MSLAAIIGSGHTSMKATGPAIVILCLRPHKMEPMARLAVEIVYSY
jgi:Cys-tRNA synthase (O-phospho-L-seryl-tRNA:Cys-tRNA synthase)